MDLVTLRQACESIRDWWRITPVELERLAKVQLGPRANGWLRKGAESAIVGSQKYGAVAGTLDRELSALTQDTQRILAMGRTEGRLQAVAFYHVRFENIHPLHDGNGRVGRILMTGQLYQGCQVPPPLFERHLVANQVSYRLAFEAANSADTYGHLLTLLSQIVQIRITDIKFPPGFTLDPLHRPPGIPPNSKGKSEPTSQSQRGACHVPATRGLVK